MIRKKKILFIIVFCVLIPIAYILLSYSPLGTELQFTPEWTIDISKSLSTKNDKQSYSFRLGQSLGYFTSDGDMLYTESFAQKATISDKYFSCYALDSSLINLKSPDGRTVANISASGFPFIDEDRIFVFLPGGASFSKYDSKGYHISTYEGTSPIIAFNSSPAGVVAGFADGRLISFTSDGHVLRELEPGASAHPVILGADISKTGKYIACLSGQNKQRFILYENEKEHSKVIFHENFDKDLTRQTMVYFNQDEDTVYFNYKDGLGIVNCLTGKAKHIKLLGTVLDIQESPVSETVYILSKNKDSFTVTVLESKNTLLGSFSFNGKHAFIRAENDMLFLGRDNKISKISLSKE